MKNLILILAMLVPFTASADYLHRCDPPATKSGSKAATITANAIKLHLKNIDQIRAGVPAAQRVLPQFDIDTSTGIIAGHSRMCYQFFKAGSTYQCDYSLPASATMPAAPAVCAWSKLSAGEQAKVRDLGVGP